MTIALQTLGVAFAAFCVWLAVRIVNRRERWAKWRLSVVVALPVLYLASFGPACWLRGRDLMSWERFALCYRPIIFADQAGPMNEAVLEIAMWCGGGEAASSVVEIRIVEKYYGTGAAETWH